MNFVGTPAPYRQNGAVIVSSGNGAALVFPIQPICAMTEST